MRRGVAGCVGGRGPDLTVLAQTSGRVLRLFLRINLKIVKRLPLNTVMITIDTYIVGLLIVPVLVGDPIRNLPGSQSPSLQVLS